MHPARPASHNRRSPSARSSRAGCTAASSTTGRPRSCCSTTATPSRRTIRRPPATSSTAPASPWGGSHSHAPSEHAWRGKRYAMELHLVHRTATGLLGVVGVFLEERRRPDNPLLEVLSQN